MTNRIEKLRSMVLNGEHKKHRMESLNLSILNEDTKGLPFPIRKALAFDLAVEKMPIFLLEGDLICGGKTVYQLPTYITEDEIRWGNHNFETKGFFHQYDNCFNLGQDERGFGICNSSVPAYYRVLQTGIPAMLCDAVERKNKAEDAQKRTYYESVIIALKASLKIMKRYEDLLVQLAAEEVDATREQELLEMSANIAQLQEGKPLNFWQACQLLYFVQFLIWTEGGYLIPIGRLDQFLLPFYSEDLKNNVLDQARAMEILESFFIKLNYEVDRTHGGEIRINSDTGQSITIGGIDPVSGRDACNELTMMVLDAKCDVRMTDPKVHLRITRDTPSEIWEKAAYLNSLGMGFPTYENDEAIITALMNQGDYSLDDARDYAASGCWEITIPGRAFNRNLGGVCSLRCLELAMNNGKFALQDSITKPLGSIDGGYGIPTGEPEWFDTYEKLFNAFKVQMKHHIDMVTSYTNRAQMSPSPFYSAMMEDCLERGADFDNNGVRYTETDFQLASLSNAADALYAIKKLVYEDREFTLRQFNEILLNNWEGNEQLRQRILNDLPKFGNGVKEVDDIANEIIKHYTQEVIKHRNSFGQRWRARISSATAYVYGSRILGASADGRHDRDYYSDNLSPMMGADRNGPTAIILSCGNLDFSSCSGGAVLDLKFHPSSVTSKEGREKFIALLKSYCALGGQQVQINVLDNKVLLDAQKHPDLYPDLMVRIWGFSAYFVQIAKHWQDHIIQRSTLAF
jgi:pyruvate-formate lyase